jgi:hypothetical protein
MRDKFIMNIPTNISHDFKIGEVVELNIDWDKNFHRGKRCQIVSFQTNGYQQCAKVFWRGNKYAAKMTKEYGVIFPVEDLKKIQ